MASKTRKTQAAQALPTIPKELVDQFGNVPMNAEAANAASMRAFVVRPGVGLIDAAGHTTLFDRSLRSRASPKRWREVADRFQTMSTPL